MKWSIHRVELVVIWIEAISHSRYIEFLVTVIVFSYIRIYYWVLKRITMSENLNSILLNKTNHHLAWPEYLQKQLKKMGRNYLRMCTPVLFFDCLTFFF